MTDKERTDDLLKRNSELVFENRRLKKERQSDMVNAGNYLTEMVNELKRATQKFGAFNSAHEGYAIIKEEVDELWDAIKKNDLDHARKEAIQVGAMALRFLIDTETEG